MIAGIKPEDVKVMRDESEWVAEQLQRLERAVFHLSRTLAQQRGTQEPIA